MILSAREKLKYGNDFKSFYELSCAIQNTYPIHSVVSHLADGILDVNIDRLRYSDWEPVIQALKINRNLSSVAFRSDSNIQTECTVTKPHRPAAAWRLNPKLLRSLCQAISASLQITTDLVLLELQNISLVQVDVVSLCNGIAKNRTLRHLSFHGCPVGDPGVAELCRALRHAPDLATLNLSGCQITPVGASHLAELIKFQAIQRHNAAWQESLRYRYPALDQLGGLRRITLNDNMELSDAGAKTLADALFDDLWVKAIDLQACNLSDKGALIWLRVLLGSSNKPHTERPAQIKIPDECKGNHSLVVVDLRRNPNISRELLRAVTERALLNSEGKQTEFNWLKAGSSSGSSNSATETTATKWPGIAGFRDQPQRIRTCLNAREHKGQASKPIPRRPSSAQQQRGRPSISEKRYRSRSLSSRVSQLQSPRAYHKQSKPMASTLRTTECSVQRRAVWKPPGVVRLQQPSQSMSKRAMLKKRYTFTGSNRTPTSISQSGLSSERRSSKSIKSSSILPLNTRQIDRLIPKHQPSGRRPKSGTNAVPNRHSCRHHMPSNQSTITGSFKGGEKGDSIDTIYRPTALQIQLHHLMNRVSQLEEQLNRDNIRSASTYLSTDHPNAGNRFPANAPLNADVLQQLNELVTDVQPLIEQLQSARGESMNGKSNTEQLRKKLQVLCGLVRQVNPSKSWSNPTSFRRSDVEIHDTVQHGKEEPYYQQEHRPTGQDMATDRSYISDAKNLDTGKSCLARTEYAPNSPMNRTSWQSDGQCTNINTSNTAGAIQSDNLQVDIHKPEAVQAAAVLTNYRNCSVAQENNSNYNHSFRNQTAPKHSENTQMVNHNALASALELSWSTRLTKVKQNKKRDADLHSNENLTRLKSDADRLYLDLKGKTISGNGSFQFADKLETTDHVSSELGKSIYNLRDINSMDDKDSTIDAGKQETPFSENLIQEKCTLIDEEDEVGETITDDEESIRLWSRTQSSLSKFKKSSPLTSTTKPQNLKQSCNHSNLNVPHTDDSDLSLDSANDLNDLICEYSELEDGDELTFVEMAFEDYDLTSSRLSGRIPTNTILDGTSVGFEN